MLRAEFGQAPQAVDGAIRLRTEAARGLRVYADGMTAEEGRGSHPLVVVLHGLRARGGIGVPQRALAVAHDEAALHAVVVAALLQLGEVALVLGLVHEELI